jgi:predicted hydrocarbon binding protein
MNRSSDKNGKKEDKIPAKLPQISLPSDAIKSLRIELSNLLGKKLASGVLFRFGYRCGEALYEDFAPKDPEKVDLDGTFKELWNQTGLGRIVSIENISEEEIVVKIENSTESLSMGELMEPICDYTRGYLGGLASKITGNKYYCVESECAAKGDSICTFHLVMFPHRIYVPRGSKIV